MNVSAHHFHQQAPGLPLVLLHAFPLDHRMWLPVIDRLPQVPIIAPDAPGFGHSPVMKVGLAHAAQGVAELLEAMNTPRAILAGVSMGGYTALQFARDHGAMLAGLVLLDTKSAADTAAAAQGRRHMAEQAQVQGAQVLEPMLEKLLSPATLTAQTDVAAQVRLWASQAPVAGIEWAQLSMAERPDSLNVLAQYLHLPSAVIRGQDDAVATGPEHATMAAALGVEVETIAQAGHLAALEQPDSVARILLRVWKQANPQY